MKSEKVELKLQIRHGYASDDNVDITVNVEPAVVQRINEAIFGILHESLKPDTFTKDHAEAVALADAIMNESMPKKVVKILPKSKHEAEPV